MKLYELYSKEEAIEVINEVKALFKGMGFTVSYDSGGHALMRLLGRDKDITKEQMLDTFKFLILTQKKAFKPMRDKPMASMIVRDLHNNANYVLNFKDNDCEIMTAIKKQGFKADHDRQGSVIVDLRAHPSRAAADVGQPESEAEPEEDLEADPADPADELGGSEDSSGGLVPGDDPIESPELDASTEEPDLGADAPPARKKLTLKGR